MPNFKSQPKVAVGSHLAVSILIVTVASLVQETISSSSIRLASDDFQVYTRAVFIDNESTNLAAKLYTFESYSAAMRAGNVYSEQMSGKFLDLGLKIRSSFYYTDKLGENRFMLVPKYDPNCRLINGAQLARRFFGNHDLSKSEEKLKLPNLLMLLPVGQSEQSRHVFGLARLLLFFEQFRAQFKPYDQTSHCYLKNVQVNEFKMSLQTQNAPDLQPIEVLVQVQAGVNYQADQLGDRIPLRMRLTFPWKAQLVVDFNQLKRFEPAKSSFNLPVGRGCSQWLIEALDPYGSGYQLKKHPTDVFSFKFELLKMESSSTSPAHIQSSFVAYDGQVGLMRVESMQLSDNWLKHKLTIHDLNMGLKFHVSGSGGGGRWKREDLLNYDLDQLNDFSSSTCTKTKLSKLELLPCEQIVPSSGYLAKMGVSEVRGVECFMYESKTKRLPRMIFESVGWFEKKQERNAFELPKVYNSNITDSRQPEYLMVHHLAADDVEQPGRLLRIDVYDSDATHKYQVEVYNFQWRLTEAPNGDSQQDLFSLSQRCQPPDTWKHLIEMQLELKPAAAGDKQADVLAKLGHSPTRQTELVRGVSAASASISGSQILDVSSRVIAGKVRASFRLLPGYLVSGPPLIRVLTIGSGALKSNVEPSSGSYTFGDCFWEAAAISSARASTQTGSVGMFSFCFERCWIDSGAKLTPTSYDNHSELVSDIFKVIGPCHLFLLEQQVSLVQDSTSSWPTELQLDELRLQLEDKMLNLAGEKFQVARVDLGLGSNRPPDDLATSWEFEGVAFTEADNEQSATQPVWRPAKPVESFEHCQSECISNSTCRSYSYCLQPNGRIECLLAPYNLMAPQIRSDLHSKLDKNNGSQASSIAILTGDDAESSVKLRLSKRCRMFAKLARDLFKQTQEPHAGGSSVYADQISPVSSQEQCAEMCLNKNAGYFRRLARFQVEMETPSGGEQTNLNKSPELHDKHLDTLRYWCDRYKFLSLNSNSRRSRGLREQLKSLGSKELQDKMKQPDAFGLCYLARGRWARRDAGQASGQPSNGTGGSGDASSKAASSSEKKVISLKMDTFEFRYAVLYKRQEGFRLNGMKSDKPEAGGNQFKLNNEQTILEYSDDLDFCARWCFTQSAQWCRSFDVIYVNSSAFHCVLNLFSFGEALKMAAANEANSVRIDQEINSTVRFEHFEPLDGYTLDIVDLKVAQDNDNSNSNDDDEAQDQDETKISPSGSNRLLTACVLGGFLSGLALAVLAVIQYDRLQLHRFAAAGPILPEVNLARLSFSLPVGDSGQSSLLSQDQLEIRHNAQD